MFDFDAAKWYDYSMREKIDKLVGSRFGMLADRFINSPLYSVAVGIVCIFAHSLNIPVVGAALLILLLVPALIFCKNSFTFIPFVLMCSFVMSEETKPQTGYYNSPLLITVLVLLLAIAAAAFAFNIVYYGKWKLMFKRVYLTVSLAILTGLLLIGGMGAPSFSLLGVGMSLAIAAAMFLPYSMLVNCGEYEGSKTIKYFAWALIAASVVIFFAVIKQYAVHGLNMNYHPKDLIAFGYAISNTAAAFVLISIPVTFYMVYVYKHGYLFIIAVAVELMTIALTFSRASLVVALPGSIIVATALCFLKKEGKRWYWIAYGVCAIVIIAIAIAYRHALLDLLSSMFREDSTGSGRTELWKSGFEAWKQYPIFGLGIWYLPPINLWYFSFHCSPLTYLYCTGAVGLLGYIYHRYKTVRLTFSAKLTVERIFVALAVLAMLLNALLDIAMTMPQHLLYYSVMLALIELDVKKTKEQSVEAAKVSQDEENTSAATEEENTAVDDNTAENIATDTGENL